MTDLETKALKLAILFALASIVFAATWATAEMVM